jgi:hypothetical protein
MARRDEVSEGRGRTRLGPGIAALLLGCAPAPRPATVVIDVPPATASAPPLVPRAAPAAGRAGREGSCAPLDAFHEASMWKALPPHDPHGPMEILAWARRVDDRPWALDAAVVWFRYTRDGGGDGYKLAHLARNPHLPAPEGDTWSITRVYDLFTYKGAENYDHPPTGAEVRQFFKDTMWEMKTPAGWKSLGSGLCRQTWERVIGEPAPDLP